MSVWSTIAGTVTISKTCHYSLKTGLQNIYDEVVWHSDQTQLDNNRVKIKFEASISLENLQAAQVFDQWIREIRQADPNSYIDTVAHIRFV